MWVARAVLSWIPSLGSACHCHMDLHACAEGGGYVALRAQPSLCSHTAQRLYCAYYQASVCNHITFGIHCKIFYWPSSSEQAMSPSCTQS